VQQWLRRYGKLCARDFAYGGFIAGTRNQLVDDDELGFGPSGSAQMFQNRDAIFIGPIVEDFGDKEDGDVLLHNLWFEEVLHLKLYAASVERAGQVLLPELSSIAYDGVAILDNEAKMRVTESECQRLRPNTTPNINNQRVLGELIPCVLFEDGIVRSHVLQTIHARPESSKL